MKRRIQLTPAIIDMLSQGQLLDPATPGLLIDVGAKGRKMWRYRRRLDGSGVVVKLTLGRYPKVTIAAARAWADDLNKKIENGEDPRAPAKEEIDRSKLTVAIAHARYMQAVREGRGSRAKKVNKPRTISDKLKIYQRDVEPTFAHKPIFDVTEDDLVRLVLAKGKIARTRANRLAGELKVFFGWASSLRGTEIGLTSSPAFRITDLKFPESPRSRMLSLEEIGWYLRGVACESRQHQRGMLLWLLTAARISEVSFARSEEFCDGVWTIPGARTKNRRPHRIALGPWGQSLFHSNSAWVFPSGKIDRPLAACAWYKARDRVLERMRDYAGRPVERWTPHDLRRTARSNTQRLKVDYETAEAMLNHSKQGLARIYDGYEFEDEKREWFLKWENEIARIAREVGVAEALGLPQPAPAIPDWPQWPQRRWPATRGRVSPARSTRRRA